MITIEIKYKEGVIIKKTFDDVNKAVIWLIENTGEINET